MTQPENPLMQRFRGFLPVAVDVETGGFNAQTDALLEIAAVPLGLDEAGLLQPGAVYSYHVQPFPGANIEAAALAVNGIDPYHPLRPALPEAEVLRRIFTEIRAKMRETGCHRAILVGHNAHFDLNFLNAAVARTGVKRNPFHPFSCFDTVTLGGLAYGQTVLRRAALLSGLAFDQAEAHSASYDARQTAELFCRVVNAFRGIYEQNILAYGSTGAEKEENQAG